LTLFAAKRASKFDDVSDWTIKARLTAALSSSGVLGFWAMVRVAVEMSTIERDL
jgi:hypothetical protein